MIKSYNILWKYAECMIADDDEVLFSMWYRNPVLIEQLEGENKLEQRYNLIFHIVKNNL
ncbi:MAG: hypothetical protein IJX99_04685 [Clostridia bacterium]|nr:hypothetical protein [Clostridia bacterium]